MGFIIDRDAKTVVDRERGYTLKQVGGGSDGTVVFEFSGQGKDYKVLAELQFRKFRPGEEDIYKDSPHPLVGEWHVRNISKQDSVWPLIRDALIVYKTSLGMPENIPFDAF